LARGVDAAAHRGCLRGGGHAVAVLGSGVDVCYPRENRHLYDSIIARGGAVVSEFPPGTPPDRWRFPARNLLIAAIANAVVVVEAAERGGALITARLAAEIGRPVFVVPGDVDRPTSVGCNRLIKDGAHPVLGAEDLIAELELVVGPRRRADAVGGEKVPASGADIETLARLWGVGIGEALIEVGRLELEGVVLRSGDLIFPA
jgi:DNA processing protein